MFAHCGMCSRTLLQFTQNYSAITHVHESIHERRAALPSGHLHADVCADASTAPGCRLEFTVLLPAAGDLADLITKDLQRLASEEWPFLARLGVALRPYREAWEEAHLQLGTASRHLCAFQSANPAPLVDRLHRYS